jgi:hypothetical protein
MQIATVDDIFLIDMFKLKTGPQTKNVIERMDLLLKNFFSNEVELFYCIQTPLLKALQEFALNSDISGFSES